MRIGTAARAGVSCRQIRVGAFALAGLSILTSCAVLDEGAAPPKDRYLVFFESRSTTLDSDALEVVDEIAASAKSTRPETILIRGYADRRGSAGDNAQLSDERAQTVARALLDRGIEASRVRTQAFGETSTDGDPLLQAADRRVEVLLRQAR